MSTSSIPIRPADLTPVTHWLGELRARVVEWSRGVKDISQDEWNRLQNSVKGAVSTQRVEQVLKDFLTRIGVPAHTEMTDSLTLDLKVRVLSYRQGVTIESYPDFLSEPPQIKL